MSRVQLTKAEAIEKIDKLLDAHFEACVKKVCDEIMSIFWENAKHAPRKIKGSLDVGYTPIYQSQDILLDFEKKEIIDTWSSVSGNNHKSLKSIEGYTKKYDLFCWGDRYDFGFKFFTGWLPWSKTKTGKLFVKRVKDVISKYGISFSGGSGSGLMVTEMKLQYSCNILSMQIGDPQQIGSLAGIPGIENIPGIQNIPGFGMQNTGFSSISEGLVTKSAFESVMQEIGNELGLTPLNLKEDGDSYTSTNTYTSARGLEFILAAGVNYQKSSGSCEICLGHASDESNKMLLLAALTKAYNEQKSGDLFSITYNANHRLVFLSSVDFSYASLQEMKDNLKKCLSYGISLLSNEEILAVIDCTDLAS